MERVSLAEATIQLPELVSEMGNTKIPILIEEGGQPVAVLITYEHLKKILEIEGSQEEIERYILTTRQQMMTMRQDIIGLQTQNRRIQEYLFGLKQNKDESSQE